MVEHCPRCRQRLAAVAQTMGRCPICGKALHSTSESQWPTSRGSTQHVRSCAKCGQAKYPSDRYRFYFGDYLGTRTEGNVIENRYNVRGFRDLDLCRGCILKKRLLLAGIGALFWVSAAAAFLLLEQHQSWRMLVVFFPFMLGLPFARCLFLSREVLGDRMAGRLDARRDPVIQKYSIITREDYAKMKAGSTTRYDPSDPRDVI